MSVSRAALTFTALSVAAGVVVAIKHLYASPSFSISPEEVNNVISVARERINSIQYLPQDSFSLSQKNKTVIDSSKLILETPKDKRAIITTSEDLTALESIQLTKKKVPNFSDLDLAQKINLVEREYLLSIAKCELDDLEKDETFKTQPSKALKKCSKVVAEVVLDVMKEMSFNLPAS